MFADVAHADDADAHFVHAAKFNRELLSAQSKLRAQPRSQFIRFVASFGYCWPFVLSLNSRSIADHTRHLKHALSLLTADNLKTTTENKSLSKQPK
jgi:hypothetical protein